MFPIGNAYSYTVKEGCSDLCMWMTSKLAGKTQNINPMWNIEVDLGEPTSFLDHVYLECTQRQCQISKDIVDNYRTMFESRISAWATKNYHVRKIYVSLHGLMIWRVMPKNVWNDIVRWQTGRLKQLYKVSTPCIDDHHFKEEELKSVGILSKVCSQIVLKCLNLARVGRPDILWSMNKLARSITKWTEACDKRSCRLISYNHHTYEYKQYCHVGNSAKQCRLGLFQDSDFADQVRGDPSTNQVRARLHTIQKTKAISWNDQ